MLYWQIMFVRQLFFDGLLYYYCCYYVVTDIHKLPELSVYVRERRWKHSQT